jgi:hypothetical protein
VGGGTALEADAKLAERCEPGMRALDHPAVTPEPVIALYASARNA